MHQVLKQLVDQLSGLNFCLIGSENLKCQGINIEPKDLDFLIDEKGLEKVAEIFNCTIRDNKDDYKECEFKIDNIQVHFVTESPLREGQSATKEIINLNNLKISAASLESELDFYQKWNRLKDQPKIRLIKEKIALK